ISVSVEWKNKFFVPFLFKLYFIIDYPFRQQSSSVILKALLYIEFHATVIVLFNFKMNYFHSKFWCFALDKIHCKTTDTFSSKFFLYKKLINKCVSSTVFKTVSKSKNKISNY